MENEKLCVKIFEAQCMKFGEFRLKSGMISPIYIDLRNLSSFPKTLALAADALAKKAKKIEFDRIAAIPYAGIPIGTALSLSTKKPLIYTRKETKDYGTKKQIEGFFEKGEKALVVDDLVTTGESKLETIQSLAESGLVVSDILVVLDREQGAEELLKKKGFILHSAIKITGLLDVIGKKKLVEKDILEKARKFISENKVK